MEHTSKHLRHASRQILQWRLERAACDWMRFFWLIYLKCVLDVVWFKFTIE